MKHSRTQAVLAGLATVLLATATAVPAATAAPATGAAPNATAADQARAAVVTPATVPDEDGCDYADFQDNPQGSAFHQAVRWMACEDITVGYTGHLFLKTRSVTRAETVAFLYRWMDVDFDAPGTSPYADVNVGGAYFTPITWAHSERLAVGYAGGLFKPGQPVTRGEFAAFLYRLMGQPDFDYTVGDPIPFADVWNHTRYGRSIVWLGHHRIAVGDTNTCFYPLEPITRAEMAQWLYRTDQLIERGVIDPPEW